MRHSALVGFAALTHDATVWRASAPRASSPGPPLSRTAATPTVLDVTMRQLAALAAVWATITYTAELTRPTPGLSR
jgi:hypothetical protein